MGNTQYVCNDKIYLGGLGDEDSGWLFLVLEFCDECTRSNAIFVSKRYAKILTSEPSFRWRLERLHIEEGIYFPPSLAGASDEVCRFKRTYNNLKKKRSLWLTDERNGLLDCDTNGGNKIEGFSDVSSSSVSEDREEGDSFSINVCVRFKPLIDDVSRSSIKKTATLPLHQRLALIRLNHNFTSNKEALSILKDQGEWFKDAWDNVEDDDNAFETKDLVDDGDEKKNQPPALLSCGINTIDCEKNNVVLVDPTKGLRSFDFDHVLPDNSSQSYVYEKSTRQLVCDFINATNVTCLVYGMTGSGKTFTMFGPEIKRKEMEGIVPRACQEVFEAIQYREKALNLKIEASVSVSYVEIYGNEIGDLLKRGKLCGHNKASAQRYVLSGAAEVPVKDVSDVMKNLTVGEEQKRKATTAMNERSSRAHSIFIVTLKQICKTTGVSRTSKLFMADLGGCEQTKKSAIDAGKWNNFEVMREKADQTESQEREQPQQITDARTVTNTSNSQHSPRVASANDEIIEYSIGFVKSDRMREAVYINLGLMALKACVNALKHKGKSRERNYVPYSDSKLTMMLSSGLGGNSKTTVIVCATQNSQDTAETIAAMKFGQSCRQISNSLNNKSDFLQDLIAKLDSGIATCEENIKKKERWEVREERRLDGLAEEGTLEEKGFGGVEIRKTTVLVGAEDDRKCLNILLRQKAELTGESFDSNFDGHKYGGGVGFGNSHQYGIGEKYIVSVDEKENYRFRQEINPTDVPIAVKRRGGTKGWKSGESINVQDEELEKIARTAKRNKLVYSGLSA